MQKSLLRKTPASADTCRRVLEFVLIPRCFYDSGAVFMSHMLTNPSQTVNGLCSRISKIPFISGCIFSSSCEYGTAPRSVLIIRLSMPKPKAGQAEAVYFCYHASSSDRLCFLSCRGRNESKNLFMIDESGIIKDIHNTAPEMNEMDFVAAVFSAMVTRKSA